MKAFLINVKDQTISEVEYDGNFKSIYKLCGWDCFTTIQLNLKRDTLYVDDNGLLGDPVGWFGIAGYAQPLANNALVLGTNGRGNSTAPTVKIDWIEKRIFWITRDPNGIWLLRRHGEKPSFRAITPFASAYLGAAKALQLKPKKGK